MAASDYSIARKILFVAIMATFLAVYVFVSVRIRRRRYRAAFTRIHQRVPCRNQEFLKELDIEPGTRESEVAIGVRDVLAQWLKVPAEALTPKSLMWRDPDLVPFLDSLDSVELGILLEERLGIAIHDTALDEVGPGRCETLADVIRALLNLCPRNQPIAPP